MGWHGINIGSLLIILAILLLIFGSKRVRHLGEDLGRAFKGFRKSINDGDGVSTDDTNESDKKHHD